jgi:hypothetical protein
MVKTLNTKEKIFLLNTNYIGELGYIYNNEPFIAPVTYFYHEEQNNITCHLSNRNKINALRKKIQCPYVCPT